MKILVTGNMGYVGPLVVRRLRLSHPNAEIIGYDAGYFAHALIAAPQLPERLVNRQVFGDVRRIDPALFAGVDAVVHLAAVSNDPMGNRYEAVTKAINQDASLAIAALARDAGVGHFVFASSCSVYGFAPGAARAEGDALAPQTAYALSKVGTEEGLAALDAADMVITSLRFSTACGMSDRLRLDLVLNDFVACALTSGQITVLSDGTPWRPLIDVRDMARAIDWAITRPAANGGRYLAVNVGDESWNHQVRDLAGAVARLVPGTSVSINTEAPADKRSYKVDFALYRQLAPDHQPVMSLEASIGRLIDGLRATNFTDADFRNSPLMRLKMLESHMAAGRIDDQLEWQALKPGDEM